MTVARPDRSFLADPLVGRSVDVLKAGQAASGALVASPTFPTYSYSWLRDGAFCAYALDVAGEGAAAAAFHRWAAGSIEAHRELVSAAVRACADGTVPARERMPPARYTLDGGREPDGEEPWPNFQIDGYGMWLWAFERHTAGRRLHGSDRAVIRLVADYLAACWRLKCFSCWEEFDDGEHASTLAAVAAGLAAAARLLDDDEPASASAEVLARLRDAHVVDGRLRRGPADDRLDGSLIWTAVPFGVLDVADPLVTATAAAVRSELCGPGGGVYRYRGDTYYGGGQWLLLTSSLAWHERLSGDDDAARELQAWVARQALPNGYLPEQVTAHAQDAAMIEPWVERWGPVATPLLWSHGMYVLAEASMP
jgi:GH15 family glucan-1,4-alpha-glucosidase